ncbi:acyltransferase family protein [Sphingomonas sp. NBWT7]|uniref:acyltransferase family protein n=1 Tax=Sphingomonas sp. NBWT7 TaxID=2596913 RepID=UPI0016240D02|nr:acyltransferase family protein [Sphingomonas sp. NBWT7]QNE32787.1 acyltransferase family protein [Sphingomonas sp. NBWT7]
MPKPAAPATRHYGLDWLRIGAFALLIVYHVAMVFAPWPWVVKWPETFPALIVPMALLTPWRIPLLFVVSGFATRKLLSRSPDLAGFVHARSLRLLVPLAFAMLVLLPPELWVRVRLAGDPEGLATYWLGDYWSPFVHYGRAFPNWEHMWFVVYLWAYTMVLAAMIARMGIARIDRWFALLTIGWRLVWLPIAALVGMKIALMFVVPETQGLFSDWTGHSAYLPLFVFGFALGGTPALWQGIARGWRAALAIALACAVVVTWVELAYQGSTLPGHAVMALDRAARLGMAWGVILALLRLADARLNCDHRWRAPLAEAVFPAYIVHHPVLVVLAWLAPGWGLGPLAGFAFLLGATALACWGAYAAGRRIAWLAPLIGLAPRRAVPPRAMVSGAGGSC